MFLFVSLAEAFCTVHPGLALIFNITTALHAEKKPEYLTAFVPPSIFFFHIYADTSTFHGNFALVVIFIGRKFQNLKCLGKKFISSRVPKLVRFGLAIFPVPRARSQIRQRRKDSGLLATVTLNDTYHAAT